MPGFLFSGGSNGVPTGIRTPVATVKGLCPRPLDDGDVIRTRARGRALEIGGARRDRTVDLLHAMQALSQLSYGPECARILEEWRTSVNERAAICRP